MVYGDGTRSSCKKRQKMSNVERRRSDKLYVYTSKQVYNIYLDAGNGSRIAREEKEKSVKVS